ncbi:MAG: hypothetical protein H7Y07_11675, partial [Pyrinomonadaceae bacterium]|nr:hypothetical protein [Sphingobacteriaceae bacterium]
LSRIRAVRIDTTHMAGDSYFLYIEYNSRAEYSKNPFTGEIEKTIITDTISQEFVDYNAAQQNQSDVQEYWSDYLKENQKTFKIRMVLFKVLIVLLIL